MQRIRRTFTDEFKIKIVKLYESGKTKKDIISEHNLSLSTLNNWIRLYKNPFIKNNWDENEINELYKENQRLQLENSILKEAAIILSRK
ncbi:transposase [Virgibacillus pantothenticus]|uniref:transposase n=1 Tax=Virgibacillus TaxID=84406 RepID=UPI00090A538B|nr:MULTISPECIES: transposase [Virgibacillus]API92074.1 hypothetical protein BKP57_09675 [Virgibacillus sp. 6R]MBS7430543.1 transposase [Virgibacillus sp. 19R1-5]MBU8566481.1 transposase [Virgibacillus pantothenticus]MBU8600104.1 transposase [Virgibacillus pantothenticus]MBU8633964.1 transposase [Virgibacillus pantothenticus]